MHSVLRGAGVPLGEDSCKIRIGLYSIAGSAKHVLEGRFEVKSNKDSGVISFRKVLDGFDHRVCSVHTWPLILSLLPFLI